MIFVIGVREVSFGVIQAWLAEVVVRASCSSNGELMDLLSLEVVRFLWDIAFFVLVLWVPGSSSIWSTAVIVVIVVNFGLLLISRCGEFCVVVLGGNVGIVQEMLMAIEVNVLLILLHTRNEISDDCFIVLIEHTEHWVVHWTGLPYDIGVILIPDVSGV